MSFISYLFKNKGEEFHVIELDQAVCGIPHQSQFSSQQSEVHKKKDGKYISTNIYAEEMDIYAPCALGATVNDQTLPHLKAKVIAGAANNQLADENRHGILLKEKGIVYAPDFLINAGGIINVYAELENYDKKEIIRKTENIYNTTLEILENAVINGVTTHQAAFDIAKARIDARKLKKTTSN
jgi:leucine dehydrogenase